MDTKSKYAFAFHHGASEQSKQRNEGSNHAVAAKLAARAPQHEKLSTFTMALRINDTYEACDRSLLRNAAELGA